MELRRIARRAAWGLAGLGVLLAGMALSPDTTPGYLARQGYFQAELLWGRVPLEAVHDDPSLGSPERQRLAWIPDVQAFGDALGLKSSRSYDTINPSWRRTIYNVSACDPVAFEPVRWRFPIVGSMPYLGYFRPEDARRRKRALEHRGFDVYVRTAGAYSTLGWFADPVLPHMLRWDEGRLANTLLHERAHATLWIPGSVKFNESFAGFVGNEGERRYLVHRHGADSDPVRAHARRVADDLLWRETLHATYKALEVVYADEGRTVGQKLRDKDVVLASLPTRLVERGVEEPRYLRAARQGPWNNARLVQFRTYHTAHDHFAVLLEQEGGDLTRFIARVGEITRGARDPYAALARAVGAEPVPKAPRRPTLRTAGVRILGRCPRSGPVRPGRVRIRARTRNRADRAMR